MSKLGKMPDFDTDEEEANWWFENQDALAEDFLEERGLGYLLVDKADIELATRKAETLGISAGAYVKSLFHKAVRSEAA